MPYNEISVDIDAPPDKVWDVLTDIDRWPGWTESVHGVSRISEGEFGPGFFARLDLAGGPATDWTVTDFDPGRMFIWESKAPGVHSTAGHIIEPRDGASRVTLWARNSGPIAVLLSPYLSWVGKRNLRWESEGLKRRCESTQG